MADTDGKPLDPLSLPDEPTGEDETDLSLDVPISRPVTPELFALMKRASAETQDPPTRSDQEDPAG